MSKHQAIIDAARDRFNYYGISKTTMQEIADDAGVAVGTLYLYFRNKDELIVACAEEFVEHHKRDAEAILAEDLAADEKLRKYVVSRFRMADRMRTGSRHAAELARAVLRVKPDRLQEEGQMMWDVVTKILRLGTREKLFRIADPSEDAKVFLFSIACFFPNALGEPIVPPREEDLMSVVDWFVSVWKRAARKSKAARTAH
jgi:AcrR family transcriptional regulator